MGMHAKDNVKGRPDGQMRVALSYLTCRIAFIVGCNVHM